MMSPQQRSLLFFLIPALLVTVFLLRASWTRRSAVSTTSRDPIIARLQRYLRIRTDHPDPDYHAAITFLNHTAHLLLPSAEISVHEFVPDKPFLLISVPSRNDTAASLLLTSHTDVVPAEPDKWTYPPFDAVVDAPTNEPRVYARGAQDMKSVGMQYLEALSNLLHTSWTPARPIHVTFVPDEEIGSADGMQKLVKSSLFQHLNVAIALDEGDSNPQSSFNVYYGERQNWLLHIVVSGTPGHGASLPEHSAISRLNEIIARALAFRQAQFRRVQSGVPLGDVMNVNIGFLNSGIVAPNVHGGFIMNVIPSEATIGFDIRVPPSFPTADADAEIESWVACEDGNRCPGVSLRWIHKTDIAVVTSRDPEENPFILPFAKGLQEAGIFDRLTHRIFFAATDSRYIRAAGVPCFGFSPIERTTNLMHKHDEYISVDGYKRGIAIYEQVIKHLADFDPEDSTYNNFSTDDPMFAIKTAPSSSEDSASVDPKEEEKTIEEDQEVDKDTAASSAEEAPEADNDSSDSDSVPDDEDGTDGNSNTSIEEEEAPHGQKDEVPNAPEKEDL